MSIHQVIDELRNGSDRSLLLREALAKLVAARELGYSVKNAEDWKDAKPALEKLARQVLE